MSDSVTPRTAVHQTSLSFTISQNLLKLMSIELRMPSNCLLLCCPLLPSVFPSFGVFSNESPLCMRWPKYWMGGKEKKGSDLTLGQGDLCIQGDWFLIHTLLYFPDPSRREASQFTVRRTLWVYIIPRSLWSLLNIPLLTKLKELLLLWVWYGRIRVMKHENSLQLIHHSLMVTYSNRNSILDLPKGNSFLWIRNSTSWSVK